MTRDLNQFEKYHQPHAQREKNCETSERGEERGLPPNQPNQSAADNNRDDNTAENEFAFESPLIFARVEIFHRGYYSKDWKLEVGSWSLDAGL